MVMLFCRRCGRLTWHIFNGRFLVCEDCGQIAEIPAAAICPSHQLPMRTQMMLNGKVVWVCKKCNDSLTSTRGKWQSQSSAPAWLDFLRQIFCVGTIQLWWRNKTPCRTTIQPSYVFVHQLLGMPWAFLSAACR